MGLQAIYKFGSNGKKLDETRTSSFRHYNEDTVNKLVSELNAKTETTSSMSAQGKEKYYFGFKSAGSVYVIVSDTDIANKKDLSLLFFNIINAYDDNKDQTLKDILKNPTSYFLDKKMELVQKELQETKSIMASNIEKILNRGEKLEDIVQKTALLAKQAKKFNYAAEDLADSYSCCSCLGRSGYRPI